MKCSYEDLMSARYHVQCPAPLVSPISTPAAEGGNGHRLIVDPQHQAGLAVQPPGGAFSQQRVRPGCELQKPIGRTTPEKPARWLTHPREHSRPSGLAAIIGVRVSPSA